MRYLFPNRVLIGAMILAQFVNFFVKGQALLGGYKWQSDKFYIFPNRHAIKGLMG